MKKRKTQDKISGIPKRRIRFNNGLIEIILFLLSCVIFIVLCNYYFGNGFCDDSYISLRYVQHLVNGYGLVWNIGDSPVEGFTNLAWILLLAVFRVSDAEFLEFIARQVGVLFGIGTLLVVWITARSLLAKQCAHLAWIAPLHLSCCPIFSRHAINGMETMMLCFFLMIICLFWVKGYSMRMSLGYWFFSAFLIFASTLIRPDAAIFGIAGSIAVLLLMKKQGHSKISYLLCWVSTLLLIFAALIIWKYVYFRSIIPLPAYMKLCVKRAFESRKIANFIIGHWLGFIHFAAVPLLISIFAAVRSRLNIKGKIMPIFIGSALYGFYFLLVIPIMSFHWRFLFPLYAPVVIIATVSMGAFWTKKRREENSSRMLYLKRGFLILFLISYNIGTAHDTKISTNEVYNGHAKYGLIGRELAGLSGISIAVSEVGQLPYYSGARVLDLSGLNNKFIAKYRFKDPQFKKKFRRYLLFDFGLPDIYIEPPIEYDYALIENSDEILKHYQMIKVHDISLYILRDSPNYEKIIGRIKELE